jgi:hypothetical protein
MMPNARAMAAALAALPLRFGGLGLLVSRFRRRRAIALGGFVATANSGGGACGGDDGG